MDWAYRLGWQIKEGVLYSVWCTQGRNRSLHISGIACFKWWLWHNFTMMYTVCWKDDNLICMYTNLAKVTLLIASLWHTDHCIWHCICTVEMFGTTTSIIVLGESVLNLPSPVCGPLPSLPGTQAEPCVSHSHSYFSSSYSIMRTYFSKTSFFYLY